MRLVLAVLLLSPGVTLACTCAEIDPEQIFSQNDQIVELEVLERTPGKDVQSTRHPKILKTINMKGRVVEGFKGNLSGVVEFREIGFEFACGPNLKVGDRVLLFLTGSNRELSACNTAQPEKKLTEALRKKKLKN